MVNNESMRMFSSLFGGHGRDNNRLGEVTQGFLRFRQLRGDKAGNLDHLIALGLRLRRHKDEPWTRRFKNFKAGHPTAVAGATRVLVKHFTLPYPETTVLCCGLGSEAVELGKNAPLRLLGQALAQARGWLFVPDLLVKRKHRSLGRWKMSLNERQREVAGAYTSGSLEECRQVVVLDDYCSTGVTLSEIARAVRFANPRTSVAGLVLARSRRAEKTANDHLPASWGELWDGN